MLIAPSYLDSIRKQPHKPLLCDARFFSSAVNLGGVSLDNGVRRTSPIAILIRLVGAATQRWPGGRTSAAKEMLKIHKVFPMRSVVCRVGRMSCCCSRGSSRNERTAGINNRSIDTVNASSKRVVVCRRFKDAHKYKSGKVF